MASTEPLHGASPDARAECYRCGALVRVARVGRHDRHHDWEDEIARRLAVLEEGGAGADLTPWPTAPDDAEIEPDYVKRAVDAYAAAADRQLPDEPSL